VFVLGLLLAAGLFAYETGSIAALQPVNRLEKQVAELSRTLTALQDKNTELSAAAESAQNRETEWQQRYQAEVPTGHSKDLFELIRDRMAAGVEPKRLAFVIEATGNLRSCDRNPTTKRFLVQTPLYKGANDSVSFGGETVTITARGPNATNPEGNAEAWFDPAKPLTVRFTEIGGGATEKTGKLPMHHSVVVRDSEYRFAIQRGPQGFVKVTGERCKFP
ncbi:MAG: hypothetical protein OEU25_18295, partial [Rhodospirillales bacterium]|nr:hypothetical protein [Rhodospirillales bacterium]